MRNRLYTRAFTDREYIYFRILFPPKNFKKAADLMINILNGPKGYEKHFEQEKLLVDTEIRNRNDDLRINIGTAFNKLFWKTSNTLFDIPIIGTIETVSKISKNAISNFKKKIINQSTAIFCITGKLDEKDCKSYLRKKISQLRAGVYPEYEKASLETGGKKLWMDNKSDYDLVYLTVCLPFRRKFLIQDRIKFLLLENLLHKKVYRNITHSLRSIYSCSIYFQTYLDDLHTFKFSVPINPRYFKSTTKVFFKIIKDPYIQTDDFEHAKYATKNRLKITDSNDLAFFLAQNYYYEKKDYTNFNFLQYFKEMSKKDFADFHSSIFLPNDNYSVLISGPLKKFGISKEIKKYIV
jgi:predicted Zn-dependent peptidase